MTWVSSLKIYFSMILAPDMTFYLVTMLFFVAFCTLMAFAVKLSGKILPGGCGNKVPGTQSCDNCPRKKQLQDKDHHGETIA
jgi:hypothetical protein